MTAAVAQPTKSSDPAVDDSDMLLTNERIWMLKHRPAMFDKEMEVQHIERRGKVEREAPILGLIYLKTVPGTV
jgi:hypothetical protein